MWSECSSGFKDPAAATLHWLASDIAARQGLWREWRKAEIDIGTNRVVGLMFSNSPGNVGDGAHFMSFGTLTSFGKHLEVTGKKKREFNRFFKSFDPSQSERNGESPPLYIVWFDGNPGGRFIAQTCLPFISDRA